MVNTLVYEDQWIKVRYNEEDEYVYHTFLQPIGGKPFQNGLNIGLDTLATKKAIKWLSDDRLNAEFEQADIEFAVADWGPRARKVGWKFWALVVPESVAGRASMQAIVETFFNMGVRVRIFTKVEDAQRWLVAQ